MTRPLTLVLIVFVLILMLGVCAAWRGIAAEGAAGGLPTEARVQNESGAGPPSSQTTKPDTQPATAPDTRPATRPNVLRPIEGVTVQRDPRRVEIKAWTCLSEGWLEQVACSPGTREHESLVVIKVKPRNVHLALVLAGFEPGRPGRWWVEDGQQQAEPPKGDKLDIKVRYENKAGETLTHAVRKWIADHREGHQFPDKPWIFGGSLFRKNPQWMGPGEHYVADQTGSIIGLVTFGDEVIGFSEVLADKVAVHPAQWEVNTETIPPVGTEVTVIITPFQSDQPSDSKPKTQPRPNGAPPADPQSQSRSNDT